MGAEPKGTVTPEGPIIRPKGEPRRGGDDAIFGIGANPAGGVIAKIVAKVGCDANKASELLAEARGDYLEVLKNHGK